MYDLYVFTTPNCWKTTILAEELGEPYECKSVALPKHENQKPEFKQFSAMGKVPVVVDHDTGGNVYGSPAIVIYLADKYGKLLPKAGKARGEVLEWTMFANTDLGVAYNTWNKFANRLPVKNQFAIDESWTEVARFMKAADERLGQVEYLGGKEYTVADISALPFLAGPRKNPAVLEQHKNIARWVSQLEARPKVKSGFALPKVG
jgi:GST-like protein